MWYLPWSESIKKRACRYLLQRYLGNFLEEKLTLDQLNVDLYNGTGTVCDVSLDCEALNELGDSQNWPLEIVDGYMKEITVTIPWSTLLKDDSVVEVKGLYLTVQPKIRTEPASSMLESMWSSMSSSMQLAEECLKEEPPPDSNPLEGIEMVAQAIDSVLNRVKIRFINSHIRIEHVPKNSDRGIALEIHIDSVDYSDEAGAEPTAEETDPDKSKSYVESAFFSKKMKFLGVSLYTDEFPSKLRTMARSLISERSEHSPVEKDNQIFLDVNYQSTSSDVFYETRSVMSAIETETFKDVDETQSIISEKSIEPSLEERSNQPDPILFAKITGQQDLSLRMRHIKEMDSPKVEIKMAMGSFIIFMSPRQLHTLIELANALIKPDLEDTSNIPLRASGGAAQCKPMQKADYQLIEEQLLRNFDMGHKYSGMQGWSGPGLEESDDGERFHTLTSPGANMAESFSSSVSSMNTSCTSSVSAPAQSRLKRNKKVAPVEGDPSADMSLISLRIQSLSCVLLHKDILIPETIGSDCIRASTIEKMQKISKEFFEKLNFPLLTEGTKEEFYSAIDEIEKAVGRNHLRLITTELSLNGSEKTTSHGSNTICEASIKHALLQECLYTKSTEDNTVTPQSFDLIQFDWKEDEDSSKKSSSRDNVKISFKQTSKYTRIGGEKKLLNPNTDISVKCMPFHVDVELSVIERMSATFFVARGSAASASPPPTVRSQNHCNLTLHSSLVHATLRFPIADLRSNVNREYRRVRNDFLVFKFLNSTINWQRVANLAATAVTLKATTLDLYYYEDERIPATHIARATMDEFYDANILRGASALLPTITLTFQPAKTNSSPFDSMTEDHFQPAGGNPMTTSMYIMNNLKSTQPSPFSGKKMAHQSFTKHEGSPHTQEENLIVPGTEEEMTEFTNSSVDLSSFHLDFNLPILSLQLESKQLYEILYNRINSDLLLWEPHLIDPYEYNEDVYGPINPAFGACKGSPYDSDSGNTSSEEDNMYFSTFDNKLKKGIGKSYEKKDTHNFCLTFKTGKGLLTIYAPVRDSNKRVVPGQMGEMVLEAHKLSMCHVSGLYGQPKSGQMCLRSGRITLYHEATITIPSEKPSLRIFGSTLPSHLKSTIYPSGKGVAIKEKLSENDMFSLALKVDPDKENSNLKAVCIALGIEQASLRHRGDKGIAWLTQLMDVLDVIDYPVPGYTPSTVVSELHVHIIDCAIDYRPLYLPIRTVLRLGNFAVSSNVITETNTSCLRFLAQECTLFIMNVTGSKPLVAVPLDDDKLPNIKRDYVCVVDVGLFELSLRMEDKENKSREQPQVDLSASNNLISIYTCWDSASALCRLVTYAASDGDSLPPYVPSSRNTSICSDQPIETLVGLEDRPVEEVRELSPSELQQVNDLMAEAMKESPNTTLQEEDFNSSVEKEGVEVFFFPDESNMTKKQTSMDSIENDTEVRHFDYEEFRSGVTEDFHETKPTNVQVATELGDPSTTPKPTPRKSKRKSRKSNCEGNNTDDEYCIIESQPQVVDSDLEEPVVKWFGSCPASLIEDHFTIPPERTDVLKAPKSFPMPLFRYTLCEMSVMWHMYGGSDFSRGEVVPAKKTVKIDEKPRKQGSPRTTKRCDNDKEYQPYEEERETTAAYRSRGVSWAAGTDKVQPGGNAKQLSRDWREIGGPMREHSVCVMLSLNKVKFQHEIYPPGGIHASRHTLAIHKIEILDRLSCSRINKMLTIYNLNDEPERINAYMLVVKACHLKPDPTLSAQECCLKISMLPLRFSIDQDTLAFLISFCTKLGTDEVNDDECKSLGGISGESGGSKHATPTHRPPVMSIASHLRDPPPTPTSLGDVDSLSLNENMNREDEPLMETYEAERLVNENLIQLEEDFQKLALGQDKPAAKTTVNYEPLDDSPIYFRRIVFSPDVPIRLDYVGKRVDLSAGPVAGLLMGLGHLNCSELTLKRLDYRLGLLGVEKLIQWALREWLTDIKRHQLPGLLSGIGPMRSLLQFVTGICDLVWLPVEQWRRDGRLVYGLRRGAASFTARTAVAALDITTRLLHLIQATAETAFDMLTPGPTLQLQDAYERREQRRRRRRDPARHVTDLRDGVSSAYHTVREGFAEQAATMALAARSSSGAGVLRHLPGAAVAPLALAAAGAADVLGGVRAHLEPHRARDHADRWRPLPDKPSE